MKSKSLNEMLDKHIGEKDTEARNAFENELQKKYLLKQEKYILNI